MCASLRFGVKERPKKYFLLSAGLENYTDPLLLPSKTCVLPFDLVLKRDPKNIFYYQHDIGNYTDQVLNFLFDRHEYIHTESSSL